MEGRIITIPLAVILRNDNNVVKQTNAHLRIIANENGTVRLIAACQEGVFELVLSRRKIKQGKEKADLLETDWLEISTSLFSSAASHIPRAIFWGKLISLEEYDPVTGNLSGTELAEETPEFQLSIRTADALPITFGLFQLQFINVDEVSDTADYDMLNWVGLQAREATHLSEKLREAEEKIVQFKAVADTKEAEIVEMTADYNAIIEDMEDRFFQAMNSKKRKIAELSGKPNNPLADLNLVYRQKNASNLNRVNMDEILSGDAYKKYVAELSASKGRSKRKSVVKPKKEALDVSLGLDLEEDDHEDDHEDGQNHIKVKSLAMESEERDSCSSQLVRQFSDQGSTDGTPRRVVSEPNGLLLSESSQLSVTAQQGDQNQKMQFGDDTDYGSEELNQSEEPDTDYGSE